MSSREELWLNTTIGKIEVVIYQHLEHIKNYYNTLIIINIKKVY